jgi:hypothetical protein
VQQSVLLAVPTEPVQESLERARAMRAGFRVLQASVTKVCVAIDLIQQPILTACSHLQGGMQARNVQQFPWKVYLQRWVDIDLHWPL